MNINKVSNISSPNFGIGLKPSMRNELKQVYYQLKKHPEGWQPEFLDNVVLTFIDKCVEGCLDFRVIKSRWGLGTVKQCVLSTPEADSVIWSKKSGLFSKFKEHLTADDFDKITQKIRTLNIPA